MVQLIVRTGKTTIIIIIIIIIITIIIRQFVINGWRWHTASVLRDIKRFSTILKDTEIFIGSSSSSSSSPSLSLSSKLDQINGCHQFLCDFNWKALMRVESELFFPWLSEILPGTASSLTLTSSLTSSLTSLLLSS